MLARRIVSEVTGHPVLPYDDNSLPSMVDAFIHSPNGLVPLEVTADADPDHLQFRSLMRRIDYRIMLPPGAMSWDVLLRPRIPFRRLQRDLPRRLAQLDPAARYSIYEYDFPRELRELGVDAARARSGHTGSPLIKFAAAPYGITPGPLNQYIERLLLQKESKIDKIAAHSSDGQGHLFLWIEHGQNYPAWSALRDSDKGLPEAGPELPATLSDLWLATTLANHRVLHYSRSVGWVRTDRSVSDAEIIAFEDSQQHAP